MRVDLEMKEELDIVMEEMSKRVGAKWKDIDPSKEGWFKEYSWTKEEEEEFARWMSNHIYNKGSARKMLTRVGKNRRDISQAVNEFLMTYGWSYSDLKLFKVKDISGYFMEDIKEHLTNLQWKDFEKWIYGQTVAVIDDKHLVYEWDYDRWKQGGHRRW